MKNSQNSQNFTQIIDKIIQLLIVKRTILAVFELWISSLSRSSAHSKLTRRISQKNGFSLNSTIIFNLDLSD
jgi:hypothetical protein